MKIISLFLSLLVLLSAVGCQENQSENKIVKEYIFDKSFDNAARFLAAKDVPQDSKWFALAQSKAYLQYKNNIDQIWKKYSANNIQIIQPWRNTEMADIKDEVIFYPFSGPDILNGLMFFPNAREFIMLGLEPIGAIPSEIHANANSVANGIQQVQISLGHILGRNYFITSDMLKKLGNHAFNGITGMMMFFLARLDQQILQVRKVYIDAMGDIRDYAKDSLDNLKKKDLVNKIIGVEITFRSDKNDSDPSKFKKATFFSGDASDRALSNRPEFFTYTMKYKKFFTILKAASYLMFNKEFDDMRSLILAQSTGVLQSASGIPFHFFNNENWNLSLYGTYTRPIADFPSRCQPDMAKSFKEKSKGTLPFSYDYDFKPGLSNLVLARRAAQNPITTPKFDLRNDMGIDSYCEGNNYRKVRRFIDDKKKVQVENLK